MGARQLQSVSSHTTALVRCPRHPSLGPTSVWLWGPGSPAPPPEPQGGQIQEGTPWRMRPGRHALRAAPLVPGREARRQTMPGQTWEPTHGPFSKAGAVPRAPGVLGPLSLGTSELSLAHGRNANLISLALSPS